MTSENIIALFTEHPEIGSLSALAKLVPAPLTTVCSWRDYNQIPHWRKPRILELAAQFGIPLSATDFPAPEERRKKEAA